MGGGPRAESPHRGRHSPSPPPHPHPAFTYLEEGGVGQMHRDALGAARGHGSQG